MSVIKWVNKWSGETGFVKSIRPKQGYFINTFDPAEAKRYKSADSVDKALDVLVAIGEGENNYFEAVQV